MKTFRRCILATAAMLTCAALAQTPAVPAPVALGESASGTPSTQPGAVAKLQAWREAAERDRLLRDLRNAAATPMTVETAEQESTGTESDEKPHIGKLGQEGIHIHGHWVIDVKDADGKLVQHRDFHNALTLGGAIALEGMLYGEFVPANWMIALTGATPICASSTQKICGIVQSQSTQPAATVCMGGAATCVTGLTTTFNTSTQPYSFILTGNLTATQADQVATYLGFCFTASGAAFSPQTCAVGTPAGSTDTNFSATSIASIPVASGQTVLVTVTFTFN